MKRSTFITIIKYLCCVLVIFVHTSPLTGTNDSGIVTNFITKTAWMFIFNGKAAVFTLFLLSGYLYVYSLKHINKLSDFLRKKIIRIILPLAFVVVLSIIIGSLITTCSASCYWTSKETYLYLLNILCIPQHNLPGVFLDNPYLPTVNGSLWTMSITVFSYVSCYVLFSINFKKRFFKYLKIVLIGLLFTVILLRADNIIVRTIYPIVGFYTGVNYNLYHEELKYNLKILCGVFLLIVISMFIGIIKYTYVILMPYIIMFIINKDKNKLFIQDYSYEMYLWAFPVQQFLVWYTNNKMNEISHMLLATLIAIILGIITNKVCKKIDKALVIQTKTI